MMKAQSQKLLINLVLYSTMSEILAPAGGVDSALAAINSGANAIYLGLDKFSARSSAENFEKQNFFDICRYAHAFGVKVYAALNTIIKDDEFSGFLSTAISAWNDGADAIILQDALLGKYMKQKYPQIVLHLSTQAGTCNEAGAVFANECGFDRVILARETKIEDIRKIAKIIETEVFVQGALCTCFSGQCYMSSFAGGNSGNRGKCKQPCRKKYSIDRAGFENQAYRLSLSDLCVGKRIAELLNAGVSSFKIEGRMRRPEYVAAAVSYYKNILSGSHDEESFHDLKRTFNRGNYTTGLAFGQETNLISSAVQGHIGEFVGVIKVEKSQYICLTSFCFRKGDGFKILRNGKEVGGGTYGFPVQGGFILYTRDCLKNGDKVFVTTDTSLNERLLNKKRLIPVKISADFMAGKPAQVEINGIRFRSDSELHRAGNRPLTENDIRQCFLKVDHYPFDPEFGNIKTDNAFMTVSQLNAFRRLIYFEYYEKISETKKDRAEGSFDLPSTAVSPNRKIAIIASDLNGIQADIGILKPSEYLDLQKLIDDFQGERFLYVPPFLTGEEEQTIIHSAEGFDGIYCDGYYGFVLARKIGLKFFAGTGWNITNKVSLMNCTANYICLSKELTISEANKLSDGHVFYLTSGNIKIMDLIYCPFGKDCSNCDQRTNYVLTDENNRRFPLRRYKISECRFEVFNCADLVSEDSYAGKFYDFSLKGKKSIDSSLKESLKSKDNLQNYTRGHSNSRIL